MVAGRCLIFCTAEESLNEVPSEEQVAAADYFFRRGYDPESEEVVGLDCVEEAIGGTNAVTADFKDPRCAYFLCLGFKA